MDVVRRRAVRAAGGSKEEAVRIGGGSTVDVARTNESVVESACMSVYRWLSIECESGCGC